MKQKALTFALGSAVLACGSLAANAADNPFAVKPLADGYQLAHNHVKDAEGKCGEGKCGGEKKADPKAKDGKCGTDQKKATDGKCGAGKKKAADKAKEGKCGDGKCGAAMTEGKKS